MAYHTHTHTQTGHLFSRIFESSWIFRKVRFDLFNLNARIIRVSRRRTKEFLFQLALMGRNSWENSDSMNSAEKSFFPKYCNLFQMKRQKCASFVLRKSAWCTYFGIITQFILILLNNDKLEHVGIERTKKINGNTFSKCFRFWVKKKTTWTVWRVFLKLVADP